MTLLARLLALLAGLFSLAMAAQTYVMPEQAAAALGFTGEFAPLGRNTFRADIGAFFMAAAIFTGLGLAGRPRAFLAAALLYGLALAGRVLGIVLDGAPAGIAPALAVEAVMVLVLIFAARTLPARG